MIQTLPILYDFFSMNLRVGRGTRPTSAEADRSVRAVLAEQIFDLRIPVGSVWGGTGADEQEIFFESGCGEEIDEGYEDYADLHSRFGMNPAAG